MALLNALLVRVFDVLLAPFRSLPPLVGLVAVSLATGVAMLLVFKRTSDQRRLAALKRQIHAALFEIRLFNDDLRAVFRAQGELLRHNLTYLRLTLVPMLWMIVPLVLAVAQLQFHYGYTGLVPDEPVLVTARLREGVMGGPQAAAGVASVSSAPASPEASLSAPPEVEVQTPAVWIPATREVIWRIAPRSAGTYALRLHVAGASVEKSLEVSQDVVRRSPVRLEPGFVNQLLYPAEAPLSRDGPVASIRVAYPERDIEVFGLGLHWMIVFILLSMLFAFALRKRFNVTL